HNRVRLLAAGREDAARSMVFEASADQVHAISDQRRSERIAGITHIRRTVIRESERAGAIDVAAFAKTVRLRHAASPSNGLSGGALARIRWVRVSRRNLNQHRQPALCSQSSSCGPQGLSRRYT